MDDTRRAGGLHRRMAGAPTPGKTSLSLVSSLILLCFYSQYFRDTHSLLQALNMTVVQDTVGRYTTLTQRLLRTLPKNTAVPYLQERLQEFAVCFRFVFCWCSLILVVLSHTTTTSYARSTSLSCSTSAARTCARGIGRPSATCCRRASPRHTCRCAI